MRPSTPNGRSCFPRPFRSSRPPPWGEPLRARIARLAQEIRTLRKPGSSNDFDDYVDSWYDERLAAALVMSKKIAASAGVDLSDTLRDLQSAVVEAYPKSRSAKTYPGAGCCHDQADRGRPGSTA